MRRFPSWSPSESLGSRSPGWNGKIYDFLRRKNAQNPKRVRGDEEISPECGLGTECRCFRHVPPPAGRSWHMQADAGASHALIKRYRGPPGSLRGIQPPRTGRERLGSGMLSWGQVTPTGDSSPDGELDIEQSREQKEVTPHPGGRGPVRAPPVRRKCPPQRATASTTGPYRVPPARRGAWRRPITSAEVSPRSQARASAPEGSAPGRLSPAAAPGPPAPSRAPADPPAARPRRSTASASRSTAASAGSGCGPSSGRSTVQHPKP